MGPVIQEDSPDCTDKCKSTVHGDIITAAISRRSISDRDLCSYLSFICTCCESVRDSAGRNALHVAASCGRVELVRWLVQDRNANINSKDQESSFTPLHRSIFYGKVNVTIELLKLGANTALLDSNSLTMLEHAMKDSFVPDKLSLSGEVYVWGSNTNNSLGPHQAKTIPEVLDVFHKKFPEESVAQVYVEKFHSVIVGTSGKAYSCGHGQGGRLGLGTQKAVIVPEQVMLPEGDTPVACVQAAISRDHSIFLCSDGSIYTCGLNTHRVLGLASPPQQILVPTQMRKLPSDIRGISAGLCHSVAWGPQCLYTWGLNAGQLGHKLLDGDDNKYIVKPKAVKMLNVSETQIVAVNSSDGAITIYTEKGDIYVLHEYQCRKVASRQLNVVQLSIFGGKLNSALSKDLSSNEPTSRELKIVALTNTGNLLLWQESDPHLCRCIFSLNREIIVRQVMINSDGLLFVTRDGEAFQGFIKPRRKKTENVNNAETSAFHKFLNKSDCISVKISKFPRIHRAIFIQSDVKGNDYCVIQVPAYKDFAAPLVTESEMRHRFTELYRECNESDGIHDVIFKVGNAYFPAHRYMVASKSTYFEKLLIDNEKIIEIPGYNALIFEQFLQFVYTGTSELLNCGECPEKFRSFCEKAKENASDDVPAAVDRKLSAFEVYAKSKNGQSKPTNDKVIRNPVRMLHEMAKKFCCHDLCNKLSNLDMQKYVIKAKASGELFPEGAVYFDRMGLPEFYDVTIRCSDGKEVQAHKCVLAAQTDYFNNLFSMRWQGKETSGITLPCPKTIVEALLEFLYTDTLSYLNNKEQDHLFKLLILADQLFITRLKEQCEYLLFQCLCLKNAIQFLSLSYMYNADKLKRCCLTFIVHNIAPLLETRAFDELDEDLLRELNDYYFNEKPAIQCRVITPYSTAPLEEEILSVSTLYPIPLEKVTSSQRRRPRTHKNSESNVKLGESPKQISFDEMPSEIHFPVHDLLEETTSNGNTPVLSRLRAIQSAKERVTNDEKYELKFTKLCSKQQDLSTSFEDFPSLSCSPGQNFNYSKSPHKHETGTRPKMMKISQKQRKRLSSESETPVAVPESPKNPWKIVSDVSNPIVESSSMNQIISSEKKQKENLIKIKSKSLVLTQIEDRAIDELHKFYNSENSNDEVILVERVNLGAIATPVWVPGVRRLD